MQIKANGLTFNYQVDGREGAPWLILSNSLATNLTMWDGQAAALGDAFRILRYDQRGHGETEAPSGRYTFEQLMADAVGLMDALSIKRAHFGGLSMGGATALGLAQNYGDRFDRIIICDSPCASTPATAQQWEERIVMATEKGMDAMVDSTVNRWFPPETVTANPAPSPHPRDDPFNAAQRLRRLRRGAREPRLPLQGRQREAPGPVHRRREGRHHARRDAADARDAGRLEVPRAAGRRPHLEPRPAGRVQPGGPRVSEGGVRGGVANRKGQTIRGREGPAMDRAPPLGHNVPTLFGIGRNAR